MSSVTISTDATKIADWVASVFAQNECVVYETYSRPDTELRKFTSLPQLLEAYPLETNDRAPFKYQFSIWFPAVMPEPNMKRIELKLKDHKFRYSLEGCGLYSLLMSATTQGGLLKCEFSYWSEAGARQRCSVEPGPSSVNWLSHKRLGASLVRQIKRLSNAL